MQLDTIYHFIYENIKRYAHRLANEFIAIKHKKQSHYEHAIHFPQRRYDPLSDFIMHSRLCSLHKNKSICQILNMSLIKFIPVQQYLFQEKNF